MGKLVVSEDSVVQSLINWIRVDADCDEVAGVCQEVFGGKVFAVYNDDTEEMEYHITDDGLYMGEFGEIPEEVE